MMGLPLTMATTSGPCSRLQPDTAVASTARLRMPKQYLRAERKNVEAGNFLLAITDRPCKTISSELPADSTLPEYGGHS
jgi:hypothetical protein